MVCSASERHANNAYVKGIISYAFTEKNEQQTEEEKKTHIHTHKLNCECERNQNATMAKKQKTQIVAGIYPFVTSTDIKHSLNIHTKHTHRHIHAH